MLEPVKISANETENKCYIKRKNFAIIVDSLRKLFRLLVPILFISHGILYILPFLSEGPLYLVALRNQFLIPCEAGWYLNLTFIQNFLYWD